MLPTTTVDTYAAVKTNLIWLVTAELAALEFVSLMWFCAPGQRSWLATFGDQVGLGQILSLAGPVAGPLTVDAFLAFLLVNLFHAHEVWDTAISHWRADYDLNFILPRLTEPFANQLVPEFWSRVRADRGPAMTHLFYQFVGDHEPKIRKTLIARFYEKVQVYWICQYIEMALVLALAEMLVLALGDQLQGASWTYLAGWIAVAFVLIVVNRIAIRRAVLPRVKEGTVEEIDDILAGHRLELGQRLIALRESMGLARGSPPSPGRSSTRRQPSSSTPSDGDARVAPTHKATGLRGGKAKSAD